MMNATHHQNWNEFSEAHNLDQLNKAWRLDETFRVKDEGVSVQPSNSNERIDLHHGDSFDVIGQTNNGLNIDVDGRELFLPWLEAMKIHVFDDHDLLGPEHGLAPTL